MAKHFLRLLLLVCHVMYLPVMQVCVTQSDRWMRPIPFLLLRPPPLSVGVVTLLLFTQGTIAPSHILWRAAVLDKQLTPSMSSERPH